MFKQQFRIAALHRSKCTNIYYIQRRALTLRGFKWVPVITGVGDVHVRFVNESMAVDYIVRNNNQRFIERVSL